MRHGQQREGGSRGAGMRHGQKKGGSRGAGMRHGQKKGGSRGAGMRHGQRGEQAQCRISRGAEQV